MNNPTRSIAFLVSAALLSACQTDVAATGPADVPGDEVENCTPYQLSNDRLTSAGRPWMGMDLCRDGNVVNWDGNRVGRIVATDGNLVTIDWRPGAGGDGFSGTDTVEATQASCRSAGELRDCPAG